MINVYLADLVYDTIKTNSVVPLNIGYIAAYLKQKYCNDVEIRLFKHPTHLLEAIKSQPPDVLGLSHYSWNSNLSRFFLSFAKEKNPNAVTVMGGPNIRTDPDSIREFLHVNADLDYCIVYSGEEPFAQIIAKILDPDSVECPVGCAFMIDGNLQYTPSTKKDSSKILDLPSPYLSGMLDPFISDRNLIPLFETNRGCPFGCTYCAWGISALAKVRLRPLEQVFEEIDYVVKYSAGQLLWIFCDANFGMFPRDIEIAQKLKEVMDHNSVPIDLQMWASKNTGPRNIEIAEILTGRLKGSVAIQSADPSVLENVGRGTIKFDHLEKQISYYKEKEIPTGTDLLLGLAGETAESHTKSLLKSFELGFDSISPYTIRMLPGTEYETEAQRKQYQVRSKYRPLFGAYGRYNGSIVMEFEEQVRSTKDMSELELNSFKVIHLLIYLAWNAGIYRLPLKYAAERHINPGEILLEVQKTKQPTLKEWFDELTSMSLNEWFNSESQMYEYYSDNNNYNQLVNRFMKLNFLFIARMYLDKDVLFVLQDTLFSILEKQLKRKNICKAEELDELHQVSSELICNDLSQTEFYKNLSISREIARVALDSKSFFMTENEKSDVVIYRPNSYYTLCKQNNLVESDRTIDVVDFTRFLETGGLKTLVNKIGPRSLIDRSDEMYATLESSTANRMVSENYLG